MGDPRQAPDGLMRPLARAYLRFLEMSRVVGHSPDRVALDPNEQALLEAVLLRWHQGEPMSVREAIELRDLGSPATLHKRLLRLRDLGLLDTQHPPHDKRSKFLYPTAMALAELERLGRHLHKAHAA
ncbi:MAG: hypothetical protein RIQ97_2432 [Pseudomonadota bacterium]